MCRESLQAGGFTWAYRRAEATLDAGGAPKTPLLLLHGLGSASYSYRHAAGGCALALATAGGTSY